ncbi:solute carrier family 35 member G1 [Cimex lectularius]|uniref:EamA domain-containing protein n=1 Tax=Cimex lectularius TaxID=79782 RepID=A0A8I6R9D4_CIMLE|nr:solute carrier family 35 member G1 [Cimex lectularius]XP_014241445.1 solute carrier family 35 member G1 [Cimex lectularius]
MFRQGLLLSLSSAFLISVCSYGAKSCQVPVGELSFVMYCMLFLFSLPVALLNKDPAFPGKKLPALWGRSLCSAPVVLVSNLATRMMPLADEALLAYTSIAFTVISARFFLGESCKIEKVISTCSVLLGVVMITGRPVGNYPDYVYGCFLSFLGAFCDAGSYIFLKKLTSLHYSVIILNYSLSSMFLTFPFFFFEKWTLDVSAAWIPFLATVQELLVTLALATEQAGVVCLVHASDIVFSYMWEILFYNEDYTPLRISGTILITASVAYTAIVTEADDKPLKPLPPPELI